MTGLIVALTVGGMLALGGGGAGGGRPARPPWDGVPVEDLPCCPICVQHDIAVGRWGPVHLREMIADVRAGLDEDDVATPPRPAGAPAVPGDRPRHAPLWVPAGEEETWHGGEWLPARHVADGRGPGR